MGKTTYIFTVEEPIAVCHKWGIACPFANMDSEYTKVYCSHPDTKKRDSRLISSTQNPETSEEFWPKPDWCPLMEICEGKKYPIIGVASSSVNDASSEDILMNYHKCFK